MARTVTITSKQLPSTGFDDLAKVVDVATIVEIRFRDQRAMARYRARLYACNKDNAFGWRWRSERSFKSSLTLYVWRMS